jgi:hypothetical protein
MPKKPLGGLRGISYPDYLRGSGAKDPAPTHTPPKGRKALIRKRLPIVAGQKEVLPGLGRHSLPLRGRFHR